MGNDDFDYDMSVFDNLENWDGTFPDLNNEDTNKISGSPHHQPIVGGNTLPPVDVKTAAASPTGLSALMNVSSKKEAAAAATTTTGTTAVNMNNDASSNNNTTTTTSGGNLSASKSAPNNTTKMVLTPAQEQMYQEDLMERDHIASSLAAAGDYAESIAAKNNVPIGGLQPPLASTASFPTTDTTTATTTPAAAAAPSTTTTEVDTINLATLFEPANELSHMQTTEKEGDATANSSNNFDRVVPGTDRVGNAPDEAPDDRKPAARTRLPMIGNLNIHKNIATKSPYTMTPSLNETNDEESPPPPVAYETAAAAAANASEEAPDDRKLAAVTPSPNNDRKRPPCRKNSQKGNGTGNGKRSKKSEQDPLEKKDILLGSTANRGDKHTDALQEFQRATKILQCRMGKEKLTKALQRETKQEERPRLKTSLLKTTSSFLLQYVEKKIGEKPRLLFYIGMKKEEGKAPKLQYIEPKLQFDQDLPMVVYCSYKDFAASLQAGSPLQEALKKERSWKKAMERLKENKNDAEYEDLAPIVHRSFLLSYITDNRGSFLLGPLQKTGNQLGGYRGDVPVDDFRYIKNKCQSLRDEIKKELGEWHDEIKKRIKEYLGDVPDGEIEFIVNSCLQQVEKLNDRSVDATPIPRRPLVEATAEGYVKTLNIMLGEALKASPVPLPEELLAIIPRVKGGSSSTRVRPNDHDEHPSNNNFNGSDDSDSEPYDMTEDSEDDDSDGGDDWGSSPKEDFNLEEENKAAHGTDTATFKERPESIEGARPSTNSSDYGSDDGDSSHQHSKDSDEEHSQDSENSADDNGVEGENVLENLADRLKKTDLLKDSKDDSVGDTKQHLDSDKLKETASEKAPASSQLQQESIEAKFGGLRLSEEKNEDDMLETLRGCVTIEDFVRVYETKAFQDALMRLQASKGGQDPEEWAKKWAIRLRSGATQSDADRALNRDRQVCLALLHYLCDHMTDPSNTSVTSESIIHDFKSRRVVNILSFALVLDRAQCLYKMQYPGSSAYGMHWVAKKHVKDAPSYWNPLLEEVGGETTINKRLIWLYELPELGLQEIRSISRWLEPQPAGHDADDESAPPSQQ